MKQGLLWKWLSFLPCVGLLGTFAVLPIFQAAWMSLTDAEHLRRETHWVGLGNFGQLFADSRFWSSLTTTGSFVAGSVLLQFILGLVGALCLNGAVKGAQRFFRGMLLVPFVLSELVVGLLWLRILDTEFGAANGLLSSLGVSSQSWLHEWALPAVIAVNVWWGTAFSLLLFEAALKGIPDDWYAAADVDGAGRVYQFRHITLPSIKYIVFLDLVYITLFTINTFGIVFVLTFGGPGNSTEVLGLFMWKQAFRDYRLGYGAAISVLIFGINILLTVAYLFLFGRTVLARSAR